MENKNYSIMKKSGTGVKWVKATGVLEKYPVMWSIRGEKEGNSSTATEKPFILSNVWVIDTWPSNFPSQMTANCQSFNLPLSLFNETFFLLILDILSLWDRKLSE